MKRLVQGSVLRIPLLKGLGHTYAKYMDLTKISDQVRMPDIIKVYNMFTADKNIDLTTIEDSGYLLEPILIAGLRPTLKKGIWENIGTFPPKESELFIPDFKLGNETYESIENEKWYLIKDTNRNNKTEVTFDQVRYLQPYAAQGTGNIEMRLTMYYLLQEGKEISEYFDLNDDGIKWNYLQTKQAEILPSSISN